MLPDLCVQIVDTGTPQDFACSRCEGVCGRRTEQSTHVVQNKAKAAWRFLRWGEVRHSGASSSLRFDFDFHRRQLFQGAIFARR